MAWFLLPVLLAPPFPFSDWARIGQSASSVSGGFAPCDAETGAREIGDLLVQRPDGLWRLFGAVHAEDSNRWVGVKLDGESSRPLWVYQGISERNEMRLGSAEAFDPVAHENACTLIFRR